MINKVIVPILIALLLAARPAVALAHGETGPGPAELWRAWNGNPSILLALGLLAGLYLRGLRALWGRAGTGRGVRRWEASAFALALATLFSALISPLDRLGGILFSAHMLQHILLILVAAPLLVLGRPNVVLLWALPLEWRRRLGRWWRGAGRLRSLWHSLIHPAVAWLLYGIALWIWHIPALYQAALQNELVHLAEHVSFFGSALLFWWVLTRAGVRRRLGYGAALLYIFTTMMQGVFLGVLLTIAPIVWYPAQATGAARWGLAPLEDQQLAGLIMWIPAGPIYLLAFLLLAAAWLRAAEREVTRWEHAWAPPSGETTKR